MKKLTALFLSLVMMVAVTACAGDSAGNTSAGEQETPAAQAAPADDAAIAGENGEETATQSADITIGVSLGQNVHPYFVAMQKGIEQACADLGIENLNVLAADGSLETQVSQIENLVTMGCDAILLNPYDSDGVVNAVAGATAGGVKIITMDIDCQGSDVFIASDNNKVGQMLAEHIIEALGGEGKIAIIDGISVTSLKDRTEGFLSKIAESNIEVVAEQYAAMERSTALEAAETILQANPDISAFVGVNENSGMAILSAVTAAGLQDNVLITTVDATSENLAAIRDGKVAVGISQNPYMMGYQAVEQAVRLKNGESVEAFIEVEVAYMTQDNVQEYITREQGYGVEIK